MINNKEIWKLEKKNIFFMYRNGDIFRRVKNFVIFLFAIAENQVKYSKYFIPSLR